MKKWIIDPAHSEVGFKVKHLMINNVKGYFKNYSGEVLTNTDDFNAANITFKAETSSIDTGNDQRDNHLKSGDFFNAEKYQYVTFTSSTFENDKLIGNLTIGGITKMVSLDVEHGGIMKDPWGNTKAGFTLSGKINRKEWGLNWNATLEAGGLLVSEDVTIHCEIQLLKEA